MRALFHLRNVHQDQIDQALEDRVLKDLEEILLLEVLALEFQRLGESELNVDEQHQAL